MNALVRGEWLRLCSRRGVVALLVGGCAAVLLLMAGQIATHQDDYTAASRAFRAERQATYQDDRASYLLTLRSIGAAQMPSGHRDLTLAQYIDGEDFIGGHTDVPTRRFDTAVLMVEMTKVATVVVCLMAFLVGATWAGAEWANRTLHALMTWESRRSRVVGVKVGVLLAAVLATYLLAQGLSLGLGVLGGATRGTTAGLEGAWWLDRLGDVGRGALAVAAVALIGFGLAFLARSTGFALGAALIWFAGVESVVLATRPRLTGYTLRGAVNALLDGGSRVALPIPDGSLRWLDVSAAASLTVVAVYVCVVVAAATGLFVRRDLL